MSKEPNLVRGVNMARSLVYRQQHHGRNEQDRIDAKKWMEEFGRSVDPPAITILVRLGPCRKSRR
jgi:hypothetical protein